MASALLADLLRGQRFTVVDLGGDTPPASFVAATRAANRQRAVVVGAIGEGRDAEVAATLTALRAADVGVPLLAGGPGIARLEAAQTLGADGWTGHDGRAAMARGAQRSTSGRVMIALREMTRAKVRFGLLIGSIALLVFLILFQQALRDGLLTSFVGAVEHQSAPVLVFSTDARRSLQGSTITPELETTVRGVDGVGRVGRIGQSTFSVRADGRIQGAAVIGYERRSLGAPEELVGGRYPAGDGEAIANESDAGDGFAIGDVVRVEPGGAPITIVGQAARHEPAGVAHALRPVRHVGAGRRCREPRRRHAVAQRARASHRRPG